MLTEEQKKDYIQSSGIRCPHCKSEDITGGSAEFDAGCSWQRVSCENCGESWRDVYTFSAVEDDD